MSRNPCIALSCGLWLMLPPLSGLAQAPEAPAARAPAAATEALSTDDDAVRALWSALDASWDARDAERFSALFAVDASFEFVDRGQRLEGRASIRRHFAERFPQFAPDSRHRTRVCETRELGPGLRSVDGRVEILRDGADGGTASAVTRTFAIFAVMSQVGDGWKIRMLRAYRLPPAGASLPPPG